MSNSLRAIVQARSHGCGSAQNQIIGQRLGNEVERLEERLDELSDIGLRDAACHGRYPSALLASGQ
jgi:hypothetical protein